MSNTRAVTIDFHDTLFHCDDWFLLEVQHLLPSFLEWHGVRAGVTYDKAMITQIQQQYRSLRREIIEHGIEMDAVSCVLSLCEATGMPVEQSVVEEGVAVLMRATLDGARPRDGAVDLVRELRASGTRLGVISNAVYHPFLEWSLAAHGIADAFDVVTTSASAGFYKSRPEIYLTTLDALGAVPERSIHIGDSYRFDVLGAARAGMRTVWLDLRGESNSEHSADMVTDTLVGLAQRIDQEINLESTS